MVSPHLLRVFVLFALVLVALSLSLWMAVGNTPPRRLVSHLSEAELATASYQGFLRRPRRLANSTGRLENLPIHCYRGRVMWHPATCSALHEVLGESGVRQPPTPASLSWSIAYVGKSPFKVAELSEVLGDVQHGTLGTGKTVLHQLRSLELA